ncbi:unnamed protein product [Brassicogethes aeneus]|uniref:Uncharacterized protein n=1 Tax=Brassicogethes aeneus TaxID=1431903 RepID=A0A9P0AR38_BRAAE|nr:unnamed protein product [Brassicogethes aeneus]
MFEVSSVGSSKLDAAEALRIRHSTAVRSQYSVKNQMMRLLRRSKSAAQPPADKIQQNRHSHNGGHHYHHNHVVHPQHTQAQQSRNGGMVVNMVEGSSRPRVSALDCRK